MTPEERIEELETFLTLMPLVNGYDLIQRLDTEREIARIKAGGDPQTMPATSACPTTLELKKRML